METEPGFPSENPFTQGMFLRVGRSTCPEAPDAAVLRPGAGERLRRGPSRTRSGGTLATRTVILGGGFGGLATATELRRRLDASHEIVVVDRDEGFYIGLRKLWVLVGSATLEGGTRPRERLERQNIRFVRGEIFAIDPGARLVETSAGDFEADHVVIALGAVPRPEMVPGLTDAAGAYNLYDPTSVVAASQAVTTIERGAVLVAIAGLPYKCPPAPYEAAMLLDDHFRARGVRERVSVEFTTLQPGLLPNAGPEGARWVGEQLDRRGIRHATGRKVVRVEDGRVVFEGGEVSFDIAVFVPPHRPPAVVRESGLTGTGEWIAVERHTLETTWEGVWALGDVTHVPLEGGAALPKAGLFAEAEGAVVAAAIAARVKGDPAPAPFDGKGACFLELGGGEAALVQGEFYAAGGPDVKVMGSSTAHMDEKRRFEDERLERWLGEGD